MASSHIDKLLDEGERMFQGLASGDLEMDEFLKKMDGLIDSEDIIEYFEEFQENCISQGLGVDFLQAGVFADALMNGVGEVEAEKVSGFNVHKDLRTWDRYFMKQGSEQQYRVTSDSETIWPDGKSHTGLFTREQACEILSEMRSNHPWGGADDVE